MTKEESIAGLRTCRDDYVAVDRAARLLPYSLAMRQLRHEIYRRWIAAVENFSSAGVAQSD